MAKKAYRRQTPNEQQAQDEQQMLARFSGEIRSFSGPTPPPDVLRQYDELDPGRAAKILDWIQVQSNHRMSLESRIVDSDISRSKWGLIAGFVVAIFTVGTGGCVAIQGYPTAGATIATAAVVALVGTFVYGTHERRRERESKAKTIQIAAKK